MSQGHEIDSRSRGESGHRSLAPAETGNGRAPKSVVPSLEAVLRAIASAAPEPWFPSAFASASGIARDSLDEPLAELRKIGLAQIADWIRGQGQGYALTPAGETAAKNPGILATLRGGPPSLPPPELETLTAGTQTVANAKPIEDEYPLARSIELDLRPPFITPVLLIANLSWFIVGLLVAWRWNVPFSRYLNSGDRELLLRMGAIEGGSLLEGDWYRLITCCFVHIGLLHLLVNLFALIMTGPLAEVLWGRLRLTIIYLISGLAGSCMAMILQPVANGSSLILAGASGAIWGLMSSLLAWLLLNRERLPPALVADWSRKLTLMFLLNIGVSFIPGVSWAGHLGGALGGFIAAGLVNAWRLASSAKRIVATLLLLALPFIFLAALAGAMKTSAAWTTLRAVHARETAAAKWTKDRDDAFRQDIATRLEWIRPTVVQSLVDEIAKFVITGQQKTNTKARLAYTAAVDHLRQNTQQILAFLKEKPTGNNRVDTRFAQAYAFARAQLIVLDHVRRLLDAKTTPEGEEWKTLRFEREQANRFAEPLWGKPPPPPLPVAPAPRPETPTL